MRFVSFILSFLLLGAGCTQATLRVNGEPVALPARAVTPEAVAAQLTEVETLGNAAEQLAGALGVTADQVRVRIRFDQCITCNADQYATASSAAGLTLAEAEARLQPGAMLWLFVDAFTCTYTFDGAHLTPQTCQIAPL